MTEPARVLTHPAARISPFQLQAEQTLYVPIVTLLLLRKLTLEQGKANRALDEVLHAWSEVATQITQDTDPVLLQQVRAHIETFLTEFSVERCYFCGDPVHPQHAPYCSLSCSVQAEGA